MGLDALSSQNIANGMSMDTASATDTSDTAIRAAIASGRVIVVHSITVTNRSATDSEVDIKDGSTIKDTISAPANGGAIRNYNRGWPCSDDTALNFASLDSVTTMHVSAETSVADA